MPKKINFFSKLESKKDSPKAERESLEKDSRREFLKKLGAATIIFGLGSVETALSTGCATRRLGLRTEQINQGLERFYRELEDPNNYCELLENREFVIKNEIFDSYARTVDRRPDWLVNPIGGYVSENYLDTREEEEFRERLANLGLPEDEINFYETLLTSTDVIILRESVLQTESFLNVLPHERIHREIKHLNANEYRTIRQAAQELMNRRNERGISFVRERRYSGEADAPAGFYNAAAHINWEEFYTYLAQGEFDNSVEQALRTEYPEAYEIFDRIKNASALRQ